MERYVDSYAKRDHEASTLYVQSDVGGLLVHLLSTQPSIDDQTDSYPFGTENSYLIGTDPVCTEISCGHDMVGSDYSERR